MDFIFEISVKKPLKKDSLYIWGKFFLACVMLKFRSKKVKDHGRKFSKMHEK